jgi:hypothetical protein
MRATGLIVGLTVLLGTAPVQAQEPESRPDAQAEEQAAAPDPPRLRIRVLRHPYDIASFYRGSNPGSQDPFDFSDQYPIASFYRADPPAHPEGYSRFWSSGYSGRGAFGRYGRRIGEYGDLFLLAPTFLAPMGTLTAAFSDER